MNAQELFLKEFDRLGSEILNNDGHLVGEISSYEESEFYAEENIMHCGVGEVIEGDLVGHGDHHVEMEAILKVSDRFFKISYEGVGKDLDEYVDYSIEEVVPIEIMQTIYVAKDSEE